MGSPCIGSDTTTAAPSSLSGRASCTSLDYEPTREAAMQAFVRRWHRDDKGNVASPVHDEVR
jgi:hypothetical protein